MGWVGFYAEQGLSSPYASLLASVNNFTNYALTKTISFQTTYQHYCYHFALQTALSSSNAHVEFDNPTPSVAAIRSTLQTCGCTRPAPACPPNII